MLTIKNNVLFMFAGVDESNSANQLTYWPQNPQKLLNNLWEDLRKHYEINDFGLIMTDSTSFPLSWGVIGRSIAHCGFKALNITMELKIFMVEKMQYEKINIANGIAAAAALEMGEGAEQNTTKFSI